MPLVSWAQAKEDIYILRALRGVRHDVDNAFYIDVGANDPVKDSVTKLFYDAGWHGINIEASPTWYRRLVQQRPRDINLHAAVSDEPGEVIFYDDGVGGLGTVVASIASAHQRERQLSMPSVKVPAVTLTEICEKHALGEIHFLKIDVEGAEASVVRGMDFSRFRPWVICIESHIPLRPDIQVYAEWEPLLLKSGYKFVFTDLIKRYYLSDEKADRAVNFTNPIDEFMYSKDYLRFRKLEDRVIQLEHELETLRASQA